MKLQFLKIEDSQSHFLFKFNWDNVINSMPEFSEYIIESNTCEYSGYPNENCEYIQIFQKGTRTLKLHIHPCHPIIMNDVIINNKSIINNKLFVI